MYERTLHHAALACFTGVLLVVAAVTVVNCRALLLPRRGRAHRLSGLAHLLLLAWLLRNLRSPASTAAMAALGVVGAAAAYTASVSFKHTRLNDASGTLDAHATVTSAEMLEHAFYQGLNAAQVAYLAVVGGVQGRGWRMALSVAAASPWLLRRLFPTHSFRLNYRKGHPTAESYLYHVKKWQYVFYKHALFFGMNAYAARYSSPLASPHDEFAHEQFALYWFGLNCSYVFEFYMQTLVKKGHMAQRTLLVLQVVLMLGASLAALPVLWFVDVPFAVLSVALNFARAGRDTLHHALLLAGFAAIDALRGA